MRIAQHNAELAAGLVRSLRDCGLRRAVVSPGSRNTPLVLALDAAEGIEVQVLLDERSAAFFALGVARSSDTPVLLCCTSGSAGAHYLPAVIEADQARVPLILATADRPRELQGCGAPQTIDQSALFGRQLRAFIDLSGAPEPAGAHWLRTVALRAMDGARGSGLSGAGPVHLNVPFREPLFDAESVAAPPTAPPAEVLRGASTLSPAQIDALWERLRRAPRGAIVCGPMRPAHRRELGRALGALADLLGWPVLAEPTSQLRFGRQLTAATVTTYDALLRCEAFAERFAPELILRFGQAPTSKALSQWIARHGRDRSILVNSEGAYLDPTQGADTVVASQALALCDALVAAGQSAPPSPEPEWRRAWMAADAAAERARREACSRGLWEGGIARAVVDALGDGGLLHVASSMPVRDLDGFTPLVPREIFVHANRGANGIDGTLSTALGEASAWDRGPALLLCGDLAFLHDLGGLVAARRLGVRATAVVVDNGGGGIFDFLPIARFEAAAGAYERYFLTPQEADLAGLCRAAGVPCHRVDSLDGLRSALAAELERPGLGVVQVVVDRNDNRSRHEAAWAAVARALEEEPCLALG